MTELSLYEQFNPLTTVAKQIMVELFQGDALDTDRWDEWDETGTGTFSMVDAIDEGFSIKTDSGGRSGIGFNNIRQYAHDGSVVIFNIRSVDTVTFRTFAGFRASQTTNGATEWSALDVNSANSNFGLFTADASTGATTQGSITIDTLFHTFKIETGSSDVTMDIDGILDVTRTDNRPTVKMQPIIASRDDGTTLPELRIRYLEAFNT